MMFRTRAPLNREQSIPKIPAKSVPALRQEPEISIGFGLGS